MSSQYGTWNQIVSITHISTLLLEVIFLSVHLYYFMELMINDNHITDIALTRLTQFVQITTWNCYNIFLWGAEKKIQHSLNLLHLKLSVFSVFIGCVDMHVQSSHHLFSPPGLLKALQLGHHRIAQLLINNGADVNAVDPDTGKTTLHIAIDNHMVDMVKHLVKRGAQVGFYV